jgi:hypothetical protein
MSWRISTEKRNTEREYWVNGVQLRGKDFYTINLSYGNRGWMVSVSVSMKYLSFNRYRFT